MTHGSQDVYIDRLDGNGSHLAFLQATIYEDTSNNVVTVSVRDVAGPNVWTPVMRLSDLTYEGESGQIRHWSGLATTLEMPEDYNVMRLAEPMRVRFATAPRTGGCRSCSGG